MEPQTPIPESKNQPPSELAQNQEEEQSPQPTLKLEQLFNKSWIDQNDGNDIVRYGLLFLYTPIGLLLFLIRTFMALHLLLIKAILPDSKFKLSALRIMGTVLGVTVSTEGEEINCPTLVSNSVTSFDHLIMYLLTGASFVKLEMSPLPGPILRLFQLYDRMLKKKDISNHTSTTVFYPERATTNGKVGILLFLEKILIDERVQPVGISVTRPFLNVNTVESGLMTELFFLFFVPYTHYNVKFLPVQTFHEVTTAKNIATSIGCIPTTYSATDKANYIKKLHYRPPSLATMARNVQQQLHPVILSPESILAALQKTGSVEKAVEELRKSIAQPSFPKSATQRMMSFQERKRLMIASAKEKYCEKHGLEF